MSDTDIDPDTLYRLTDALDKVREERDQHAATIGVLTTERDALIEEVARLKARVDKFTHSEVSMPEGLSATCTYCRSVGACPRCWGRAAVDELTGKVARLTKLLAMADRFIDEDGNNIDKEWDGWCVVINTDRYQPVENARFDSEDAAFVALDEWKAREAAKDDDAEPTS